MITSSTRRALMLVSLMVFGGCSSRPETVIVSGNVRYQGEPLTNGEIRFLPMAGTAAPTNGGLVVNGRYLVAARGGLLPGRYRVEIEQRSTTGNELAMPAAGEGPPRPTVKIPPQLDAESTLEALIPAEPRRQTLDFDLTASSSGSR